MHALKFFYYNEDLFYIFNSLHRSNFFLFYPRKFLSIFSHKVVFFLKVKDFAKFENLFLVLENFFFFNNINFLKFSNYFINLRKFFFFNSFFKFNRNISNNTALNYFDFVLYLDDYLSFRYVYDFFLDFFNFGIFDFLGVKLDNKFLNFSETSSFTNLRLIDLNRIWFNRYLFFLLPKFNHLVPRPTLFVSSSPILLSPLSWLYCFKAILFFLSIFKFSFSRLTLFFNRFIILFYAYTKSVIK